MCNHVSKLSGSPLRLQRSDGSRSNVITGLATSWLMVIVDPGLHSGCNWDLPLKERDVILRREADKHTVHLMLSGYRSLWTLTIQAVSLACCQPRYQCSNSFLSCWWPHSRAGIQQSSRELLFGCGILWGGGTSPVGPSLCPTSLARASFVHRQGAPRACEVGFSS